jgi:hypothetical protein
MRIDGPQVTSSLSLNGTTITDLNVFVTTGSLNGITGSYATTGSNLFKGDQTHSGSIIPAVNNIYDLGSPTNQFRHVYISTGSLYIDGTKVLGSTSSELQITTDTGQSFKILETGADTITLQSNDGNVTLTSTGGGDIVMDPSTGVIGLKGTVSIYTGNKIVSSDGNAIQFGNGIAITGSIVATGTNLISGSSQVLNGSGVWSGSVQLPSGIVSSSTQLPSGIVSSSSQVTGYGFATTGSNNFQGTQTITGSLYISANLVVQGSSSLQDVTGSNVYIGTNKINLNTDTPSIRFGGISVFDSGSNFGESGSLLWDSQNNRWLYQHPYSSGAPYKSAILISGPKNSGSLGSEETLTSGKIMVAVGDDHIGNSIITETNGGIGISGSLSITGSVLVGVDKGIIFDSSGASGHPEISVDSNVDLNFKNTSGLTNLKLKNNGDTIISGSITSTGTVSAGTTFNWNGGIGALSYGSGVVTLETNTANAIELKTNGTAAITISTGQTATFANNIGLGVTPLTKLHLQGSSPNYILLTNTAADGVGNAIQGGIIGQSRGYSNNLSQMASILFRNENSAAWYKGEITFNTNGSDGTNPSVSPTERLRIASGGNIGINEAAPSKILTVNFGTSISDGLLVTGTQRQETRFKSSGEHSNVFIDSGHQNIYLPTLALLRSGSSFGEVKLQRASNSDSMGSFAESEMIIGSTTSVPISIKTNEVRRIRVASGGGVEVFNSLSVSGNLTARNFSRSIKTWNPAGSTGSYTIVTYNWADELAAISGNFDSGGYYKGFIRSGNGAHYYGYHFDILIGSIGYGGNSLQFKVQNITPAHSPWSGGCGPTPFGTIDNTSFEHRNNPCGETLELSITKLGV